MKFSPIVISGFIVTILAIGGGIYLVTTQSDDGSTPTTTTEVATGDQAEVGDTKEACEVFTQTIANNVLGEGATKAELPPGAQASTDDVSVTNCVYEAAGSDVVLPTANVLVRGAKTNDGKDSNKFGFEGNQDRSNFEGIDGEYGPTEPISGLGDAAFYDPDFEQVNVLVDDGKYWLIVQADTRAQAEQLAGLLVENL